MSRVIAEWVSKAEGDLATAQREIAAASRENYDAVCFHVQQCVEKLIKAVLIARGTMPPKIHDLEKLDLLLGSDPVPRPWSRGELRRLTHFGIAFRYPGDEASLEDAQEALAICERLRIELLRLLPE